jgi:hypothetical protein
VLDTKNGAVLPLIERTRLHVIIHEDCDEKRRESKSFAKPV